MNKYIEAINAEIATLRNRINTLEDAKKIIANVDGPTPKIDGATKASKSKKTSYGPPSESLMRFITEYAAANPGPFRSRDIIEKSGRKQSSVWTALSAMKGMGAVVYNPDTRTYTMTNAASDSEAA